MPLLCHAMPSHATYSSKLRQTSSLAIDFLVVTPTATITTTKSSATKSFGRRVIHRLEIHLYPDQTMKNYTTHEKKKRVIIVWQNAA